MPESKYAVEEIIWLDHVGPASWPDHTPKKLELERRVSVGYVVYEDWERLVFAGTVDTTGCHDMTALGTALIVSRKVLS